MIHQHYKDILLVDGYFILFQKHLLASIYMNFVKYVVFLEIIFCGQQISCHIYEH